MKLPPPLRFLLVILLCWAGGRAAFLALPPDVVRAAARVSAQAPPAIAAQEPSKPSPAAIALAGRRHIIGKPIGPRLPIRLLPAGSPPIAFASAAIIAPSPAPAPAPAPGLAELPLPRFAPTRPRAASRWSGAAWLFLRGGDGPALAPAGGIGGDQAGARLLYRLNRDMRRALALSARAYAPLADADAAEVALGLDWKPSASLPVHLLAERRQAAGSKGRSAFAALVHGGASERPLGPLRLDAYAQAGIVGVRSRDLFADGALRVGLPMGRAKVGLGLWGAAQPGAERLDIGPQASLAVPGTPLAIAVDWRLRIAGNAAPRSGPALTLSTGF